MVLSLSPERTPYVCPVAPWMSLQLAPVLSQSCHWYVKVAGPSAHFPGLAVSVSRPCALREMDGCGVARGAALPEITSVAFEFAVAEPSEFVAFTCTRTVLPTSASV